MSTAERLSANPQSPIQGRLIAVAIANGASLAIDLQSTALLPAGLTQKQKKDFWQGRFLRITATGGPVHFAASPDLAPPLALGFAGVTPAPTVPLDVGIPIADGAAPELYVVTAQRYLKFSNSSGGVVTVTISTASEAASGLS